ncbi:MAG: hypothetical protein OSB41_13365 [Kiritimatiellae bacterium]|nr:hypothetical protein [Kiritimatiellia bacterium]
MESRDEISESFSKELLIALHGLDLNLGRLDKICSSLPDGVIKVEFTRALGDLIGDIYSKLMIPIYRRHPVLGSPDEPGPWLKDAE